MISIATWIKDKTNIKSTLWNDSAIYCHTTTEIRPSIAVLAADEHWPSCVLPFISLNWMLWKRNLLASYITVFLFFFLSLSLSTNNVWEIRIAVVLKMCLYFSQTEVYIAGANGLLPRGEANLWYQAKQSSFYNVHVTRLLRHVFSLACFAYSFRKKTGLQIWLQRGFIKDTENWKSRKRIHFRTTK